jgi:predicted transcriptional regulator
LDEIFDKLLSSDTKLDLLMLFHSNPGLVDGIEGVARRIGRTASEIETDVKDLIDLGVLVKEKFGKLDAVSFDTNKDKQIQEIISNQLRRGAD